MIGEEFSIKINDYLARYRLFVEQENRANRYNINIRAESFFIPILSILFECNDLNNLNIEGKNYPGIDLADDEKRIAIQITSETKSSKVIHSLEKFLTSEHELYKKYDRLIVFMLREKQNQYSSNKIKTKIEAIKKRNKKFDFNVEKDIVDVLVISSKINDFSAEIKEKILFLLKSEIDGDFLSPLSKMPISSRTIVDIPLIGREEEYEQLKNGSGDMLVVGHPGIGKTFLLYKLAQDNSAYFLNQDSRYNLLNAINIIKPKILFIDDAHKNPEMLLELLYIRNISENKFRIIATCWPTAALDTVKYYGNFDNNEIISLGLFGPDLLADLLFALLDHFNLSGNDPLTQNIINQSNGFPGIAVGHFLRCINKSGIDVINGKALLSHIAMIALETRNQLEWYKTKKLLACFSVGGKYGIPKSHIADMLKMSILDIEMFLNSLSYGGIVFENQDRLIIRPPLLRTILVKDEVFFSKNYDLFDQLIQDVTPDVKNSLLLDIQELGGEIPERYFDGFLSDCSNNSLWERYYRLFPKKIMYGIIEFPNTFNSSIIPALYHFPEEILPLMLKKVSSDDRPPHSYPDHVFRIIPDWLNWDYETNETIVKRKLLLNIIKKHFQSDGNSEVVSKVLAFILAPSFDHIKKSVGSGEKIAITRGYFSEDVLDSIFDFWPDIYEILKSIEKIHYINVLDEMRNWVYEHLVSEHVQDQMIIHLHGIAKKMIFDIASISENQNSILRICNQYLFDMGEEKKYFTVDSFFETIYPVRYEFDVEKIEEIMEAENQDVIELAILFSKNDPKENYLKMSEILKESRLSANIYPDHFLLFITTLARNVDSLKEYIKFLINDKENPEYLKPFLDKIFEDNKEEFIIELTKMIDYPKYYQLVLNGLLSLQEPPRDLLDNCLEKYISQYGLLLQGKAKHGEISLKVLEILLNHPNNDISFHVAIGEWYANPYGRFREELEDSCKKAISDSKKSDSLLSDIFKKNSNLGYEWLGNYLRCKSSFSSEDEIVIGNTIKLLNSKQREGILKELSEIQKLNYEKKRLIKNIVENDIDIFRYLLELDSEYINEYKLAPLGIFPDNESWLQMALIAFENGFSESDIVYSCFSIFEWISVTQLEKIQYYEKFITDFNNIYEKASIENSKIRKIALQGMYISKVKLKEQKSLEEMKSIFGFDEMY
jgi:hypothetical protein